jgi:hypothetical protein
VRPVPQSSSPYQIERQTSLEQLDALEKEWSALLDDMPAAPIFLAWEWMRTWWLFFGEGRELWLLTARDRQGKLVGIGPWMKEEYKKGMLKLGMLAFIGTGRVCPTHLNILARDADQDGVYRAFLAYLACQPGAWDVLRIGSVLLDSPEYCLLTAAGGRLRAGGQTTCLYIPLPGSWDAFLHTTSRNHRYNLRNTTAKLEAAYPGAVEFSEVTDPQALDKAMARLEDLIRDRCHARNIQTDWDDPTFARFHRSVASTALEHGQLLLCTLTVQGQIIGILYNFYFKNRVYGYNAGYEIDWKRFGLGHLMIGYVVKTAIEKSAVEMGMGRGDAAYKFTWTGHVRVENELLFGHSWKGHLWIALGNFERSIRARFAELLTRLARKPSKQSLAVSNAKLKDQSRHKEDNGTALKPQP